MQVRFLKHLPPPPGIADQVARQPDTLPTHLCARAWPRFRRFGGPAREHRIVDDSTIGGAGRRPSPSASIRPASSSSSSTKVRSGCESNASSVARRPLGGRPAHDLTSKAAAWGCECAAAARTAASLHRLIGVIAQESSATPVQPSSNRPGPRRRQPRIAPASDPIPCEPVLSFLPTDASSFATNG